MRRRAVGTVVLSMALIILALAILVGAHVIYYSLAAYSAFETPNLSNIRFYYNGQELPAWLQYYSSSPPDEAQLATAWVRLPFSIPPHGSATIYMAFNGSGWDQYWGEAPTLSTPYGAHDNGQYVFLAYGAFGSGFDGWKPGVYAGSFAPTPSEVRAVARPTPGGPVLEGEGILELLGAREFEAAVERLRSAGYIFQDDPLAPPLPLWVARRGL